MKSIQTPLLPQIPISLPKTLKPQIHLKNPKKVSPFLHIPPILTSLTLPPPSFAADASLSADKISVESILISIDNFLTQYPFFAATCAFIWLIAIPLTEEYLMKYKFISAIDAFRKLRDVKEAALLDIRKRKSLEFMPSPKMESLGRRNVDVEFVEGEEERFVKEVLAKFDDPGNTVLCIIDNFDGKSLEVAELLFKNGFKEAYAIKGGLRGNDGWQAIQDTLLPPAVRVYPRKKNNSSSVKPESKQRTNDQNNGNGQAPTSSIREGQNQNNQNGRTEIEVSPKSEPASIRPLSPYFKYPDLKPPSSPTPSKPKS